MMKIIDNFLKKLDTDRNTFLTYILTLITIYLTVDRVVEFLLKNYDNALIFFEKCKIIDGNRAEIYNNIGCCLLKLNDNKNAEINFKIALSINNEYGDASINLKNLNRCKLTERELRKVLTVYS